MSEIDGKPDTLTSSHTQLPRGVDRREITSEAVKAAMSRVPRQYFVPEELQSQALEDRALAIGHGQTISQPFIVALMSEAAEVGPGSRVLEIGTGSGYQAAVLAELGATVFSIEIIPALSERARQTLQSLGYLGQVQLRVGDGTKGWADQGPFDAILVTAAAPEIPDQLLEQLAPHGRMVIPVEQEGEGYEQLLLIERDEQQFITKRLGAVKFVPFTGALRESPMSQSDSSYSSEREGQSSSTSNDKTANPGNNTSRKRSSS